jgi:hypothetical protein
MSLIKPEQREYILMTDEFRAAMKPKLEGLRIEPVTDDFLRSFHEVLCALLLQIPFTSMQMDNASYNELWSLTLNDMEIGLAQKALNIVLSAKPIEVIHTVSSTFEETGKGFYLKFKDDIIKIIEQIQSVLNPLREETVKAVFLQLSAKGSIVKPS